MKNENWAEFYERSRPMDATFVTIRIDGISAFVTEVERDTRDGFEHTAAGKAARHALAAMQIHRGLTHHEMGQMLKAMGQMLQDAKDPREHTTHN